jgi:hypothetical protein
MGRAAARRAASGCTDRERDRAPRPCPARRLVRRPHRRRLLCSNTLFGAPHVLPYCFSVQAACTPACSAWADVDSRSAPGPGRRAEGRSQAGRKAQSAGGLPQRDRPAPHRPAGALHQRGLRQLPPGRCLAGHAQAHGRRHSPGLARGLLGPPRLEGPLRARRRHGSPARAGAGAGRPRGLHTAAAGQQQDRALGRRRPGSSAHQGGERAAQPRMWRSAAAWPSVAMWAWNWSCRRRTSHCRPPKARRPGWRWWKTAWNPSRTPAKTAAPCSSTTTWCAR